jgi:F-type H+-transporting ATPase subunit delta
MRGLSRTSLAEVEERFNAVAGSADLGALSDELFAVADLLDREHGLRRGPGHRRGGGLGQVVARR